MVNSLTKEQVVRSRTRGLKGRFQSKMLSPAGRKTEPEVPRLGAVFLDKKRAWGSRHANGWAAVGWGWSVYIGAQVL